MRISAGYFVFNGSLSIAKKEQAAAYMRKNAVISVIILNPAEKILENSPELFVFAVNFPFICKVSFVKSS